MTDDELIKLIAEAIPYGSAPPNKELVVADRLEHIKRLFENDYEIIRRVLGYLKEANSLLEKLGQTDYVNKYEEYGNIIEKAIAENEPRTMESINELIRLLGKE